MGAGCAAGCASTNTAGTAGIDSGDEGETLEGSGSADLMKWPHWRAPSCVRNLIVLASRTYRREDLSPMVDMFWLENPEYYPWVPVVFPSYIMSASGRWFKSGARFEKYGRSTRG